MYICIPRVSKWNTNSTLIHAIISLAIFQRTTVIKTSFKAHCDVNVTEKLQVNLSFAGFNEYKYKVLLYDISNSHPCPSVTRQVLKIDLEQFSSLICGSKL